MPQVYKRAVKKNYKTAVPRPMRSVVNQQIIRNAETKYFRFVQTTALNAYGRPSDLNYQSNYVDIYDQIRSIVQGTGQGNRLGNQIRLTKVKVNFLMTASIDRNIPALIMFLVLSDKHNPNTWNAADYQEAADGTSTFGNILQNGNSSSGFFNRSVDTVAPINEDRFTVHERKTFKLSTATDPVIASVVQGNNEFPYMQTYEVDLLQYMPKIFRYNDNSTLTSLQRRVNVCIHGMPANGDIPGTTDGHAKIYWSLEVAFKDV